MAQQKHKSIAFVLFTRIGGFIFFLLILFFLNFLVDYIENDLFQKAVELLNDNIMIIVIMSILFLISELFSCLLFPFDLPAPIFAAIGSLFLVTFGLKVAEFVDKVTELHFYEKLNNISFIIYGIVFILVLIGGYFEVFRKLLEPEEKGPQVIVVQPVQQKPKTWKDIRAEFRQTISDFLGMIRDKINRKRTVRD